MVLFHLALGLQISYSTWNMVKKSSILVSKANFSNFVVKIVTVMTSYQSHENITYHEQRNDTEFSVYIVGYSVTSPNSSYWCSPIMYPSIWNSPFLTYMLKNFQILFLTHNYSVYLFLFNTRVITCCQLRVALYTGENRTHTV